MDHNQIGLMVRLKTTLDILPRICAPYDILKEALIALEQMSPDPI